MQATIDISWLAVSLFLLILVIPAAINTYFRLKLGKEIVTAVARMTIQLILVGLYLGVLFELNNPWLNIAWLLVMVLVGASAILSGAKLPKRALFSPLAIALSTATFPLMVLLLIVLLQPSPFYSAQYLIPLAGMLLGNCLSGNIVALQRLFSAFSEKKADYESALVLGATPRQAAWPFVQSALQQSQAPILASMATTGLVTLPGMMTGQILGGTDPMIAVKYQLIIMVAIFVMLSVSVTIALLLTLRVALHSTGYIAIKQLSHE
ncbi:ABC transporter permease [Shewanella sp. Scap07]|uniref:ABC transporter permease n=1 Tax=Shewanella sp. Scap07 TaxID=2589987 RepID=UPI0015C10977|nr:ABC transporter permease [Shewanella sp. Scap07]QLE86834.1 ABC transporter permease [Shewanella sp. Scap07]